jgi:hypothetical protein
MNTTVTSENSSGRGKESVVPPEICRWNWGAFLLNWVWGIGNSTYIALLMFVPLVNFAMLFVLGSKGSEWAWRNRVWRDVEHFKAVQKKWAWVGLIVVVVLLPTCVALTITAMKQSDAFALSLSEIQRSEAAKATLGVPIEAGFFVSGNFQSSGPDGRAALQYSVKGSKAEGEAFAYAIKQAGQWELKQVVIDVPSANKRISIVGTE